MNDTGCGQLQFNSWGFGQTGLRIVTTEAVLKCMNSAVCVIRTVMSDMFWSVVLLL